jgi:hypothetical protein
VEIIGGIRRHGKEKKDWQQEDFDNDYG